MPPSSVPTATASSLSPAGTLPPDIHNLPSLLDWVQDFEAGLTPLPAYRARRFGVLAGTGYDLGRRAGGCEERSSRQVAGIRRCTSRAIAKEAVSPILRPCGLRPPGLRPRKSAPLPAPRVGDVDFAAAYDRAISALRYEYMDDIVPHVPIDPLILAALRHLPFLGDKLESIPVFDYADLGTLRFINWDKQIVGDSDSLKDQRILHLATLIVEKKVSEIVSDHHAACGFGYMTQVCPGVCPAA